VTAGIGFHFWNAPPNNEGGTIKTVLPFLLNPSIGSRGMRRSKFTMRDGLVMLLGVTLVLIVMLWVILSGIVRTDH
jgi:hypothetical protein